MFSLHFVADFICQSREMGQKKSTHLEWLAKHLLIQFFWFAGGLIFQLGPITAIKFALFNTLIHGIIDWNIWKAYKLSAYKRIIKEIRKEYREKFGEDTWSDDESLVQVIAKDSYQEKVKNWKYYEDHWFYTTIGFDQLLHAITIIVLYGWLV